MKPITLSVFLFAFFSFLNLHAQSPISVGVRSGIHFGKTPIFEAGKTVDEDEVAIRGFELAIPVEFGISKSFSFQPEISLTQKGSRYAEEEKDGDFRSKSSSSFLSRHLEIPLLLKWRYRLGANSIYVQSGLSPSYLLAAKVKARALEVDGDVRVVVKSRVKIEIEEEFVRFDIGVLFGGGFERSFSFGSLFLDVRYNHGLLNQEDDIPDSEDDDIKVFHRGTSVTVGFSRPLSGSNSSID